MQTFQNIYDVLTDDGVLIFLEVLSLTKGEQPYGNNGYLVLQNEQVKILFGNNNIINMKKDPGEKSNCWMITKNQLGSISKQTIKDSIFSLRESSRHALEEEFKKESKMPIKRMTANPNRPLPENTHFYHNNILMQCSLSIY